MSNGLQPYLQLSLLIYGALNATLYSGLLPLWDGFDEPFHYAYVQHLSQTHEIPVFRKSAISSEVSTSFSLAPASYLVKRNIPSVRTFDEYFRLPRDERIRIRQDLLLLGRKSGPEQTGALNYETHQAPLAYCLLAVLDAAWDGRPLIARVWRLRTAGAVLSALLTGLFVWKLGRLLNLPSAVCCAVVFLVFSSQVFYASVAHVSNDWLAVPLFTAVIIRGVIAYQAPTPKIFGFAGLTLAVGLLTKASFLALLPFAFGLLAVIALEHRLGWRSAVCFAAGLSLSAPWYLRNLILYRNLSGMQETADGTPFAQLFQSMFRLPWLKAISATAINGIWTGNNSANTFGRRTVYFVLLLLAAAAFLYLLRAFRWMPTRAEWVTVAACLSYSAGLWYSALLTFMVTKGAGIAPNPWYVEPMKPAVLCLLFGGLFQAGRAGRVLAIVTVWLWTYIISATYLIKLIPFYSGHVVAHAQLSELIRYYGQELASIYEFLSTTALLPPQAVLWLTGLVILNAICIATALTMVPWRHNRGTCSDGQRLEESAHTITDAPKLM